MDFLVMSLTFDESKFTLHAPGQKRNVHIASDMCVLACHGRLLWGVDRCDGFEMCEEEFVCKPVAMETNSVAAMWASFMQILPPALISLLQGESPCRSVAFCPTCDSASANAMLITHVQNKVDDCTFVLPGWCSQHKTGRALQPMLSDLGILSPMFCLTRRCAMRTTSNVS